MIDFICYAILSTGQVVNLSHLCGAGRQSTVVKQPVATAKPLSQAAMNLLANTYAEEYCAARSRGLSDRFAGKAAGKVMIDDLFVLVPDGNVPDGAIDQIAELSATAIAKECPQYKR